MPHVFVDYANLLDNWRREMKRISAALAIDLNTRDEGAIEQHPPNGTGVKALRPLRGRAPPEP